MDSKTKSTFATFGVFLIIAVVAVTFLDVGGLQSDDVLISSEIVEPKTNEIPLSQEKQHNIPISEMNCQDLRNFILTFEQGWGKAMAEFGTRCNDDSD